MKIELKKDFTWALVVPTSMGVRITPANNQPVHCSDTFLMTASSAESNVASVSSFLGLPVKVLTTFVKESPITSPADIWHLKVLKLSRADPGVIVISLI
jgi:2-dehydro-3-deoxygluconokinase